MEIPTFQINQILTWNDVSEIHKSRNGIYQKNGKLISLLTDFGKLTPYYPDFTGETEDEIFYTGAGRRGDQKLDIWNRALIDAVDSKKKFPLFCKLKVGVWKFLGYWKITQAEYIFDEKTNRMVWKFQLKKVKK
ncbi:MAG: hypothetical protein MUC29_03385 [Pyrinomonadaceae bacterium]|jgi:hypothetical protein|nr:hypothetical protein [Pyrinomonadaceae bacterium]